MADIYSDIPELSAEAQAIARRRKIAEAMMQRGQAPLESMGMAGGAPIPISWTQGLAQLANAYVGGEQMRDTETADKALADKYTGMETDAVSKVRDAMLGTPEKQAPFQADNPFGEDLGTNTTVTPAQATTPEGRRQAIVDAQLSRFPQVQKFGAIQQKYDEMQQAQDLAREQRKWEVQQKAQDKLDQIELQAREGRISRAEADARAAELRKSLVAMAGAMRQPPAVTVTEVMQNGKPVKIDARTGRVIGDAPAPGMGKPMSPTAQKELIQTDEEVEGGQAAIAALKQALKINNDAMGFTGAGAVASMGTLLPESMRPTTVDATNNLDNILTGSALPQLKAIFGGMPTEGERKVLLDIQGSSSKSPAVRKQIMERAIAAAEKRIEFSAKKAKALREGSYFAGDGGVSTSTTPAAPAARLKFDANGNQVP